MFCKEQVVQLHRDKDRFEAAGADVVVIGNGTPNFIAGFRKETGFDGTLYTDPSLETYKLAGMKRSFLRTISPMGLFYAVRATARGQKQTRTKGDRDQQGGVIVVRPDGTMPFAHQDKSPGDLATNEQILKSLRS